MLMSCMIKYMNLEMPRLSIEYGSKWTLITT